MKLGKNAVTVLERRYLKRDEEGNLCERPEDMFRRVADTIAGADRAYDAKADVGALSERFYQMMTDLEFLPNSPTLMNAGRELGQLSACFVLPVEDSMEGIFESIKQAALIHKSGGGTGFSFSRLRHTGSSVRSTGGVASGPVSFMRVFNMATEAVKQGGTRRGANMGILRIDHPDILEFIDAKKNNADITNFNISVGLTEAFMSAVEAGENYDLISPRDGSVQGQLSAPEVFEKIVQAAWRNGEPGIIFLDRLNRDNVVPSQGEIESTNPCGEQPLLPYESCNLGSINLVQMLKAQGDGWQLDYDKLGRTVDDAVHFLDNVIDVNRYPIEQIGVTTRLTRKIGLGVMGYADMLLRLGLPYNSTEAVALSEEIMAFITAHGRKASQQLAQIRGAFPLFEESIYRDGPPLRNATITTIAPTGTLSIIAGCSSGVEPVFGYVYRRNVMDNTQMLESNPILAERLAKLGLNDPALLERIAEEGTLAHIQQLPEELRRVFVCAHDISPEYHIRTQAAWQRHTDNAVSKTVNFSHDATPEDVRRVYLLAYELDCKGVTIYRDGSRDSQVLTLGSAKPAEAPEELAPVVENIRPRPRPQTTYGMTQRTRIGCGNLYITVNYDQHGICEVFTSTGKAGGCPSQSEATARLVSIALRSGISVDEILDQLKGIRCPSTIRQQGMQCTSCPDAIARMVKTVDDHVKALAAEKTAPAPGAAAPQGPPPRFCSQCGSKLIVKEGGPICLTCSAKQEEAARQQASASAEESKSGAACPECGLPLAHEGGCSSCLSCGFSKCG